MGAIAEYLSCSSKVAVVLQSCGRALLDLKRPEGVLASNDRALKFQPDSVEALNNRGNVLLELKRLEEALASYDPLAPMLFTIRLNAVKCRWSKRSSRIPRLGWQAKNSGKCRKICF